MPKQPYLQAGQIVGTHGVRGEMRVQPWCDSPQVLCKLSTLYFDNGAKKLTVKARPQGNMVLLKIAGIDTLEEAQALRGQILYLAREDVKLPAGRHFICDLIGCRVIDEKSGQVYGVCTDVSNTGANDIYHLKTEDGKEVLIPAIPDIIRRVDTEAGEIYIYAMLGLFEP